MYSIEEKYTNFDSFCLRSTLLPLKEILNLNDSGVFLDLAILNEEMQEAIFLASPLIYNELKKYSINKIWEQKKPNGIITSLIRYWLRMIARPTPFGLFSGCSIVKAGDKTEIVLPPQNKYKKHTRLDMDYLCVLADNLSKLPEINNVLRYYPNSSVYRSGEQYRYVEYFLKEKRRVHQIAAVDYSGYLQTIINKAERGATKQELAYAIANKEISYETALQFVEEVIAAQILVNDLQPAITGDEFLEQLIITLSKTENNNIAGLIDFLRQLKIDIEKINETAIGADISLYKNIEEKLAALNTPFESGRLFQTDMIKPTQTATLQREIINDVLKAVGVLNVFTQPHEETNLTKFKEAFYERYEDKEVPLLEVLDVESGIGYLQNQNAGDVAPLVEDLAIGNRQNTFKVNWDTIQSFVLKKYLDAAKNGAHIITLTDKEIEPLSKAKKQYNLPDTFSVMVSVIEDDGINRKSEIISAGNSSAANLLGRFCHSDENILKLTKEITAKEKELNPDAVLAEIVHLPEARIGNILLRPVLREYEIPYLAKASVEKEKQIKLSDLYLSVKNNRLFLRSKRLNKEVKPRLSSAHNYSHNAQPVYQFLCDMQSQDTQPYFSFNWGSLNHEFTFLPRVVYENVILFPATWNLKKDDFKEILSVKNENLQNATSEWRTKNKIPRYIYLADGDNKLLIDFENNLCIKTFIETIKNRQSIQLVEFNFNPETAVVQGPEGSFVNEFIISFYRKEKEDKSFHAKTNSVQEVKRTFVPGEEWLYYKLYCGTKTADAILTKCIKPLAEQLILANLIDKWFFIRYTDPKHHLRIRFHLTNPENTGQLMNLINQFTKAYTESGLIWKIQTDTYQRELERYHWENIEHAESLFYYDSISTTNLISITNGNTPANLIWLLALRSVDMLLNDFGYTDEQKIKLMEGLKNSFSAEFGMNKNLKVQLDNKFRDNRKSITDILSYKSDTEATSHLQYQILNERSFKNKEVMEKINENVNGHKLDDLIGSILHMNLNRFFRSRQRQHELVVYYLLYKQYKSEIAKSNYIKVTQS